MSVSTDQVDRLRLFPSKPQESNDAPEAEATDVEDVLTGDDSDQAGEVSLAGFLAAVTDAQHEAETQLAIILEQVQAAAAARHASELARVEERHAEELRLAHDNANAEAVERVRQEESERHTTEFARVHVELKKQHADELMRARTVAVQSIKTLALRLQKRL